MLVFIFSQKVLLQLFSGLFFNENADKYFATFSPKQKVKKVAGTLSEKNVKTSIQYSVAFEKSGQYSVAYNLVIALFLAIMFIWVFKMKINQ